MKKNTCDPELKWGHIDFKYRGFNEHHYYQDDTGSLLKIKVIAEIPGG
jgi:hypothetical protein